MNFFKSIGKTVLASIGIGAGVAVAVGSMLVATEGFTEVTSKIMSMFKKDVEEKEETEAAA